MPRPRHARPRSTCPIAGALDVLGDRWTLLVIRDLLLGKSRYGDFLDSPESIPTNLLADRLKRLTEHGVIVKRAYQRHPPRYEYQLTRKGRDLGKVIREIVRWGESHLPNTRAFKKKTSQ